ncbi:MAG: lysylphosphatidylglycerol synthase transmembrane domain-containing protein [Trebonia sp.]
MAFIRRFLASRILRWGFVALALGFGAWYIVEHRSAVHSGLDRIGLLSALGALACVLVALVCTMLVWRVLIIGLGSPLSVGVSSRVVFVGQLGKYLPGSVWPVVVQMELATEHKVPRSRAAAASVIGMCLSLLCALIVALVTLPFAHGLTKYWWGFLIALPLLICLYPPVLNWLLRLGFKILRREPPDQALSGRVILVAMAWYVVSWIFYGLHIYVMALRLGIHPLSGLTLCIGAFALSWAIGFVIILAPAGAGFRDVMLIAVLSTQMSVGAATAITLVSRVATLLADTLAAGISVVAYKYKHRESPAAAASAGSGVDPASVDPGETERALGESPRPVRKN